MDTVKNPELAIFHLPVEVSVLVELSLAASVLRPVAVQAGATVDEAAADSVFVAVTVIVLFKSVVTVTYEIAQADSVGLEPPNPPILEPAASCPVAPNPPTTLPVAEDAATSVTTSVIVDSIVTVVVGCSDTWAATSSPAGLGLGSVIVA